MNVVVDYTMTKSYRLERDCLRSAELPIMCLLFLTLLLHDLQSRAFYD